MDKKTLVTIKNQLLEEKERLEKELLEFAKKNKNLNDDYEAEFPEYGNKEDENAAEVAAYGDRLSLEHTLEKQLADVKKALASLAKDTYGICKYCGKPIEEKRLLVRSTSTSCVDCKKKLKGE
ncbi:MAG: hypothetical protein A2729_00460 [Candidatus Buchananbacteria bacterium RIFCSPHIGHO2_01_FULL_39_14]|uniref:Zinc finger DksA/TraR C4-type domain-containing protein n=2 Tax=Candidatus Buchananiibacteriota TaxID=1817903 RepID=A0A1G1YMH7_9BACT|nr:MAG: hypothetical protein A2729_00460 [Candidatus Buchananbacteria bacterium RIFCSPHIGHO2_01_FULL_39_14]OGY48727.1 MAG: hypothetical protein A3D39_04645 [Candidatus Buchananbacteria bacterium RIFCSPHIGHO2_02_FULL_39_17]OGY53499.1 MAG: hypothetical protein A2912_05955 [Candidatus Buchananbacteria bacterium RIFCSPLOWO2_01_FULL_40_23b]